MAAGATGDDRDAYTIGRVAAREGRAVGIHVNFAPDADVNNNPLNPIINTRSFGEDPRAVARLVRGYVRGLQDNGMLATLKHFPGHGDTDADSHIGLPSIRVDYARLDSVELVPFRAGIDAGAQVVMSAHIAFPVFTGDAPATLSASMLTGVLRDSLKFKGLVVTDALQMGAIVAKYGAGEAAVRAFEAGSDLLLMPADPDSAIASMLGCREPRRIGRPGVVTSMTSSRRRASSSADPSTSRRAAMGVAARRRPAGRVRALLAALLTARSHVGRDVAARDPVHPEPPFVAEERSPHRIGHPDADAEVVALVVEHGPDQIFTF